MTLCCYYLSGCDCCWRWIGEKLAGNIGQVRKKKKTKADCSALPGNRLTNGSGASIASPAISRCSRLLPPPPHTHTLKRTRSRPLSLSGIGNGGGGGVIIIRWTRVDGKAAVAPTHYHRLSPPPPSVFPRLCGAVGDYAEVGRRGNGGFWHARRKLRAHMSSTIPFRLYRVDRRWLSTVGARRLFFGDLHSRRRRLHHRRPARAPLPLPATSCPTRRHPLAPANGSAPYRRKPKTKISKTHTRRIRRRNITHYGWIRIELTRLENSGIANKLPWLAANKTVYN